MLSMLNFRSWASSVSVAVLTIGLAFAQQTTQKAVAQISLPIQINIDIQGACSGAAGTVLDKILLNNRFARDYCQGVGREEAIRRFQAQLADFAAIDSPPLDPVPVIPRRGTAIQVPIAGLSITLPFNIPEVGSLNLSRQTYCGILSGAITNWNAPEIADDNPEVTLPDLPITVVYNSNSSSSTFLFTNHLNTVCASTAYPWSAGVGMSASFPVGVSVQDDTAVVNTVASTAGALGYADNAVVIQSGLPVATLQNQAGNFIAPTPEATSVAFTGTSDSLVPDPAQLEAYPIVGLTFVLFYGQYQSLLRLTIQDAFTTGLTDGDDIIRSLGYAPLPQDRKNAAISAVNSI